ncbi:MAG TPA: redoxin domain-containing protein [Verrucomicrobiales bacterium]|nr:redoxin domain-containing protein [Verrucomicrobiales bacterium]
MMKLTTVFVFIALLTSTGTHAASESGEVKTLEIGAAAPDFNLPGVDGKNHTLAEYADADILAVIFLCNHCPSAQGAESRVKALIQEYTGKSFQLIAISPNDPQSIRLNELGYSIYSDSLEEMKLHAAEYEFNFPYLYDGETQSVSLAYGATATPHLFLFDKERKLRYAGRLDDSKFGDPATIKKHDAKEAIAAMLAGTPIAEPVTRAHGCSTKWAAKRHLVGENNAKFEAKPVTIEKIKRAGVESLKANPTDKLRLVNLWATWCGPCVAEMPQLVGIGRQFETRGFDMITISTDSPGAIEKAGTLLKRFHAGMPDLTEASVKEESRTTNNYLYDGDTDSLAEALDPEWQGTLPHTVLIAPGGQILHRFSGEVDPTELRRVIVKTLGRWYSPD